MKAVVVQAQIVDVDGDRVQLEGELGSAWVRWMDGAPRPCRTVDVELEVPDAVPWSDIEVGVTAASGIRSIDPDRVEIIGAAEELDEIGVLTLRMAGTLTLVDTVGEPPLEIHGRMLRFVVPELQVFPIHIT